MGLGVALPCDPEEILEKDARFRAWLEVGAETVRGWVCELRAS